MPKRGKGYYELYLGEKCLGTGLSLNDFLPKYFVNLSNNLKKDSDLEVLLKLYEQNWRKKGKIYYIDSWGHKWKQGPAHKRLLEYLENKQNEFTK